MIMPIRGVIHGRLIELERDAGLPDGVAVSVHIEPNGPTLDERRRRLRDLCGAWSEDASLDDIFSHSRFASYAPLPANK